LISGAIGGNVAGAALKEASLGPVENSIAGIVGGGIGGAILQAMGVAAPGGGVEVGSIVGQFLSASHLPQAEIYMLTLG
jgi:uncharacterized membrane protein YeaQ/YmgE (transglycosylase-associated protein family)